jgi:hypothetical protein
MMRRCSMSSAHEIVQLVVIGNDIALISRSI